jgi:hypothetical protein
VIFDRTQNDVDTAIRLRNEKVKNFKTLTNEEISVLEKGTITINTLNRIENKQAELRDMLVQLGYSFFIIETKKWTENDIFDATEFERIINNLDKFKDAFSKMTTTPNTPDVSYYFQSINDIEKILFDLGFLVDNTMKNINFSWAIGLADTGLNFTS